MMNTMIFKANTKLTGIATVILSVFMLLAPLASNAEDKVVQDPQTGDWVFTLTNPDDPAEQRVLHYTPQNRVDPRVRSTLNWRKEKFVYTYQVQNGKSAKQGIAGVRFDSPKLSMPSIQLAPITKEDSAATIFEKAGKERQEKEKITQSMMRAPEDWSLNINDKSSAITRFVWLYDMTKSEGILPGKQASFTVMRPELPGVTLMHTRGYTLNGSVAAALPREGLLMPTVEKIFKENDVWTPIMAPAIIIPTPFDAAELTKRIRAQVEAWPGLNVLQPATLEHLNRQFDVLIPALERKDIKVATEAAVQIMVEAFKPHRGLQHWHCSEDQQGLSEAHQPKTVLISAQSNQTFSAQPDIAHVASRALVHNMMYLLTRVYANNMLGSIAKHQTANSATTGAWSDGCSFLRGALSIHARVHFSARGLLAKTRSMRRPWFFLKARLR
jgi:hypothetical protein